MYAVLAVDLDDTLLADDKTVSARTLAALAAWEQSGRQVVIATGRPPRITRIIPSAFHHYPWICYNGAWVEHQRNVLFQKAIPVADARRIVAMIQKAAPQCRLGVEIADKLYINRQLDRPGAQFVTDVLAYTNQPAAKILTSLTEINAAHHTSASGLGMATSPSKTVLDDLPPTTRALVSPKYDLIQVIPHDVSKARALRWLLNRWGHSLDEVVAFGDDVNDIEMIAEAGLGVAMDNAVAEVKAVANRVTTSNDEDGVATIIEEILA